MLRSCKYCGRIHDVKYVCPRRPKKYHEKKDTQSNSFRNTYQWQCKREQIKARDLNLCQACLHNLYGTLQRYTYEDLEVHHIVPINEDETLMLEDKNLITLCSRHHHYAENGRITRYDLQSIVNDKK